MATKIDMLMLLENNAITGEVPLQIPNCTLVSWFCWKQILLLAWIAPGSKFSLCGLHFRVGFDHVQFSWGVEEENLVSPLCRPLILLPFRFFPCFFLSEALCLDPCVQKNIAVSLIME